MPRRKDNQPAVTSPLAQSGAFHSEKEKNEQNCDSQTPSQHLDASEFDPLRPLGLTSIVSGRIRCLKRGSERFLFCVNEFTTMPSAVWTDQLGYKLLMQTRVLQLFPLFWNWSRVCWNPESHCPTTSDKETFEGS